MPIDTRALDELVRLGDLRGYERPEPESEPPQGWDMDDELVLVFPSGRTLRVIASVFHRFAELHVRRGSDSPRQESSPQAR